MAKINWNPFLKPLNRLVFGLCRLRSLYLLNWKGKLFRSFLSPETYGHQFVSSFSIKTFLAISTKGSDNGNKGHTVWPTFLTFHSYFVKSYYYLYRYWLKVCSRLKGMEVFWVFFFQYLSSHNLPGHGFLLHFRFSISSPGHTECLRSKLNRSFGTSQTRFRFCSPPPQVFEHSDHFPHSVHSIRKEI